MKKHAVIAVILAAMSSGCSITKFSQLGKEPIRMTTVDTNFLNVLLRFASVRDEISRTLDQPVEVLSAGYVDAIKVHLANRKDHYQLLYLDPVQFCQVSNSAKLIPLAMRKNRGGADKEVGLIVVPKDSPIKTLADIKGKRFAFGPYGSPYMFYNVLELLRDQQVPVSLVKGAYYPNSLSVAQKVLLRWVDVGVVTETWWQTTTDRTLDLSKPLKDDLRIVARTKAIPEYIWAATESLAKDRQDKVRKILTTAGEHNKQILTAFEASGFRNIDEKDLAGLCERFKAIRNLPPKPVLPSFP